MKENIWFHARTLAKTIEPLLRPHRVPNAGKVETVVLDPGHGGHDKGALSRYGSEKGLRPGRGQDAAAALTSKRAPRDYDSAKAITLSRSKFVLKLPMPRGIPFSSASIFNTLRIAIQNATGFEIFSFTAAWSAIHVRRLGGAEFLLACKQALRWMLRAWLLSACIYHSMIGHIPEFDRGIKRARFAVLRLTRVPAVLVEGGFLTERGRKSVDCEKRNGA
jgi:N-acetylmuramoyl-L-alanine amidase